MKITLEILALALLVVGSAGNLVLSASIEELGKSSSSSYQITVANLKGQSRKVDISEGETVGQLKAKIAQLDGVQASSMRLIFAGKQLQEDERALSDYGIERDSKVVSLLRPSVATASNEAASPKQEAAPANKQDIKKPSSSGGGKESSSSGPLENVFIKLSSEDYFEVPADSEMTVGQLKRVIEMLAPADASASAERQLLTYNDVELEDHKTLAECGLSEGSVITLEINGAADPLVYDRVMAQVTEAFLDAFNKAALKFVFEHNPIVADPRYVNVFLTQHIMKEHIEKSGSRAPLLLKALASEDLRAEFVYVFRGEQKSIKTNMREGVRWVCEQAKAAIAIEEGRG